MKLVGMLKYSEKILSQTHSCYYKSHLDWPKIKPGSPHKRMATNHLSHGTSANIAEISCAIH